MKKIYKVYCSFPYTSDPEGNRKKINTIVRSIYDARRKAGENELLLIVPHNVLDSIYDMPVGNSNQWMLLLELFTIKDCDIFAYDPENQSVGVHWEKAQAELFGKPIVTYQQLLSSGAASRVKMRKINEPANNFMCEHLAEMIEENEQNNKMRNFESGATRNDDTNKLDFEGFLSPLVLKAYAEYMHENRKQADGKLRDSDNWQKGIPLEAYIKSTWRHFFDMWLCHRGYVQLSREGMYKALGGLLFNIQGYWFELLKQDAEKLKCTVSTLES